MICIRNKVKVNPAPFNQSFCFTSESSTLVSQLNLCKTGFPSQKTKFSHMKNYIWAKCSHTCTHTCQIFLWQWSTSILFFCSLCLGKIGSTYTARMVQRFQSNERLHKYPKYESPSSLPKYITTHNALECRHREQSATIWREATREDALCLPCWVRATWLLFKSARYWWVNIDLWINNVTF